MVTRSIYAALAVMTQELKKGQPLLDNPGNFGSIEVNGDCRHVLYEGRLTEKLHRTFT
ncbi:MAG: hypothetical protein HUJ74_00985 [Lachnospiraceae bacterium]|nr:hypothetical protein [Lachnospiraceae bacterium]